MGHYARHKTSLSPRPVSRARRQHSLLSREIKELVEFLTDYFDALDLPTSSFACADIPPIPTNWLRIDNVN